MSAENRLAAWGIDPRTTGVALILVAVWLALDAATDGLFLTARNLYNLAVQSSVVGVMASGMVLVITARHIDLSVGSLLGFTGVLIAGLQAWWLPADVAWAWPLSVAIGVAAGAALGAWQGWWVAYRRVPAFVVTLGGLLMFRGGAYLLAEGKTISPLTPGFAVLGGGIEGALGGRPSVALGVAAVLAIAAFGWTARRWRARHDAARPALADAARLVLAGGLVLAFVAVCLAHERPDGGGRGVPSPVLVWAATALGVAILFTSTRFGRYVTAAGGSPVAAARAGIDVRRVTLGAFTAMGALAGVAAALSTARLAAGTTSMGTLAELQVIAAAVIGGTALEGGHGRVGGAVLGAVLMQSLENGMVLLGVESAVRQVAIGGVLVLAVWADVATRRWRAA